MDEDAQAELLLSLPARLDCAVLVRAPDKDERPVRFEALAKEHLPEWFGESFGGVGEALDRSPFLADFVENFALEHWASGDGDALASGFWEEGDRHFYEARAWTNRETGEQILLLSRVDEAAENKQQLIQRNHEQMLDHRRLLKEIEKKEILLDCIVHDLSGPVGTLIMNLEHVGRRLSEVSALRPAVDRALNQAKRQLTMVRSISRLFEDELNGGADGGNDGGGNDPLGAGVDIIAVAHEMTDTHRPPESEGNPGCRMQFRLQRQDPASVQPLRVVGREIHISRVMENLLLNALHFVPAGEEGEIIVSVESFGDSSGGEVEVRVEDNGPGVEAELAAELFRPFSEGRQYATHTGLGLNFCRIAIAQYGGRIGYRDRNDEPGSGACFWFRLPRVPGQRSDGGEEAGA